MLDLVQLSNTSGLGGVPRLWSVQAEPSFATAFDGPFSSHANESNRLKVKFAPPRRIKGQSLDHHKVQVMQRLRQTCGHRGVDGSVLALGRDVRTLQSHPSKLNWKGVARS